MTLDRDLTKNEYEDSSADDLADVLQGMGLAAEEDSDAESTEVGSRTVSWDYLIYALGSTLPAPLVSPARNKKSGVAFLQVSLVTFFLKPKLVSYLCSYLLTEQAQQALIEKSSSILIIGGGALGLQYATDIADLYSTPAHAHLLPPSDTPRTPKKITLVHSRDRFLPLYDIEVHNEVTRRLKELGVDVVLGERLNSPGDEALLKQEREGETRKVKKSDGGEIEYDLLVRFSFLSFYLDFVEPLLTPIFVTATVYWSNSQLLPPSLLPPILNKLKRIHFRLPHTSTPFRLDSNPKEDFRNWRRSRNWGYQSWSYWMESGFCSCWKYPTSVRRRLGG